MRIEQAILSNLIHNEEYCRKVVPHLKKEYFLDRKEALIASLLISFFEKYNKPATPEVLAIEIGNVKGFTDKEIPEMQEMVKGLTHSEPNQDWLIEQSEKFCKDKAVYNAITQSLEIMNGKGKLDKGAIPSLLHDALAISFDPNVGHDYLDQYEERYEHYHRVQERLAFDLDFFNKITKNGVPRKTLNIVMGGVGGGKSLSLCHFSSSYLSMGKNVLYITLELAEEEVAKRIDANLMNITFDDLLALPKDLYKKRIDNLKQKTHGKLIIKEYPTASASTIHFRSLLNELNLKKGFVPDVIMVDYLNICASARIKPGNGVNSYTYVKAIAEELRGLAVECNVPIWSATQLTRSGYSSSDPGMEDTSESFGLPATADFFFALVVTEQLSQLNQIMVKQLKNRYNDPGLNKRFVIGVDRARMKLYDLELKAQDNIVQETPSAPAFGGSKNKFSGLKV